MILNQIQKLIQDYLTVKHPSHNIFISAKDSDDFVSKTIGFNSENWSKMDELLKDYKKSLEKIIQEGDKPELFEQSSKDKFLEMQLTKPEIEKMKQILSNFEDDESFEEFINRHDQIFLVIEIKPKTQQEDTLLLFKKMYKSSKLKKRYVISPFKQNTEFKILKGGKDFVLDLNYDFIFILRKELDPNLIYQENRCLIMNRKSFEDFFDLLVHYSNAFNQLKTVVDFIDWGDKYTEDLGRKCYKLMNSQVFNDCVVRFRKDVLENPDSELVEFLKKKEIQIQRDKTSFMIVPNSLPNLKRLLKILEDGFVKTYLLERTGLVGDFEGPNG